RSWRERPARQRRHERLPLQRARRTYPRELEQRRDEVNETDGRGRTEPGGHAGPAHDEGDAHDLVVYRVTVLPRAMLAERLAGVGGDHDDGAIEDAQSAKPCDEAPDEMIGEPDLSLVWPRRIRGLAARADAHRAQIARRRLVRPVHLVRVQEE